MSNNITIIPTDESLVAIVLDSGHWAGRAKLRPSDLGEGVDLPPEKLASLGSKKICDPKPLRIFNTLKTRGERLLKKWAIDHVLGNKTYVIPAKRVEEVVKGLTEIQDAFEAALRDFIRNYNNILQTWLADNEEWKGIIENSLLSAREVEKKFRFSFYGLAFAECSHPALQGSLEKRFTGLTGRLFQEVGQVARELYERSFEGRNSVTTAAMNNLKGMRDKFEGFADMLPSVAPLVEDMDRVLKAVPNNGLPIDGIALMGLQGMLRLLMDPEKAMEYADKRLASDDENLFDEWQNKLEAEDASAMAEKPEHENVEEPEELPLLKAAKETKTEAPAEVSETETTEEPEASEAETPKEVDEDDEEDEEVEFDENDFIPDLATELEAGMVFSGPEDDDDMRQARADIAGEDFGDVDECLEFDELTFVSNESHGFADPEQEMLSEVSLTFVS